MKILRLFLGLGVVFASLSGCAGRQEVFSGRRIESSRQLPLKVVCPEGNVAVELKLGEEVPWFDDPAESYPYGPRNKTTSRYLLRDLKTREVLAEAESSITVDDIFKGRFRGTYSIEVAKGGGRILVIEDVSDASPSKRYVLFERDARGRFEVFYLAPPYEELPPGPGEFDYALPDVRLSDEGWDGIPRLRTPFNRG